MQRFMVIALVWVGCAAAWVLLGSTLLARSGDVFRGLEGEVHGLWGPPMYQRPPRASLQSPNARSTEDRTPTPEDRAGTPPVEARPALPSSSDITVGLELEHRKKGLIWYPTYAVAFHATYAFTNATKERQRVSVAFPLATVNAHYDGLVVRREDSSTVDATVEAGELRWSDELGAGERKAWTVDYRSRGTSRWQYALTEGTGRTTDFSLAITTNFDAVDFPADSISPTDLSVSDGRTMCHWKFETLVASAPIAVELPQKLNPGPLASKITFFAPVSLLFYFFVIAILAAARSVELHPMHYFFIGCAFFAFHLLFAYMVDHVAVGPSFAIASLVSVALVVSYARHFVGWRFALREMGLSQFVYLVLFSFTFFFTGFTGLSVTIGAIATLALVMQLTGKKAWKKEPTKAEALDGCASPYRCARDVGLPDAPAGPTLGPA